MISIHYSSTDFLQNDFSVIIDQRWSDIDIDNSLRLVIWYDNEWGYSSRVVDLIKLIDRSARV